MSTLESMQPTDIGIQPRKPHVTFEKSVVVKRSPRELEAVSSLELPFSYAESVEGVSILKDSDMDKLWSLLSTTGPSVLNPDNSMERSLPIEDVARRLKNACDREIELHAMYLALVDRVKYIDRQRAKNVMVNMNRRELIIKCSSIFDEWNLTRVRCKRYRDCYERFESDRIERVQKALAILNEIDTKSVDMVNGLWVPKDEFARRLKEHLLELKMGLKMNEYFQVQNCVAEMTGRPLFSPVELSRNMELSFDNDPYWLSPIKGTTEERMHLVSAAY